MTVDIYGHWIPGEGREGLEEALKEPKILYEISAKTAYFRISEKEKAVTN